MMAATSWSQRVTKLFGGTWTFWTTPEGRVAEGEEALLHSTCSSESVCIWWQKSTSLYFFVVILRRRSRVETSGDRSPKKTINSPPDSATASKRTSGWFSLGVILLGNKETNWTICRHLLSPWLQGRLQSKLQRATSTVRFHWQPDQQDICLKRLQGVWQSRRCRNSLHSKWNMRRQYWI